MLNNFLVLLDHALFIFNANVQKLEFKQNDRTLLARDTMRYWVRQLGAHARTSTEEVLLRPTVGICNRVLAPLVEFKGN